MNTPSMHLAANVQRHKAWMQAKSKLQTITLEPQLFFLLQNAALRIDFFNKEESTKRTKRIKIHCTIILL